MLKELINAFRREDVIKELSGKLARMLEASEWMFEQASNVLMKKAEWKELSDALYDRDREINHVEQDIRERILTHLAVGTTAADVAPCLAMMNIVKDAERIGDYCKNIFEIGRFYRDPWQHREYLEPLNEARQQVKDLFAPTREAFLAGDASQARSVLSVSATVSQTSDTIIQQLLSRHDNLLADEAVAYVLLARHVKRVACHLANIATSVISPVPMLDFRKK
jgi:phosphate uptake regulator